MKRSSNGSNFAEVSNTVGGYGWPPSVTFSDGKFFVLARGGSNPRGFIHSSPSGLAWANNGPIIATHVGIVTRTAIARTNSKLLVIESRGGQLDAHVAAPGDSSSSRTLLNWSAAAPGIALAVGRTVVRQQVPKPRLRHTEWQGEIGKTGAGNVLLGSFANQPAIQGHGTGTSYKLLINPYGGNVGIGTDSPQGTLDVHGTILQRSVERHPDYVFETNYPLESIEEHAEYMWSNKHLRAVGTPAKDGDRGHVVELGAQQRGILEELEKAHIYIEQLHKRLSSMEDRLSELMAGKGR